MRQESTFRIFGTVETVEIGSTKISSNEPCAQIHLAVYNGKPGLIDRYRVSAYDAALVAVAEALQHGQQVCVVGRLRGGVNERGYYNTYFTAQAILVEPAGAPSRQAEASEAPTRGALSVPPSGAHPSELGYGTGRSWAPPRNGREAAAQKPNEDEDIPF